MAEAAREVEEQLRNAGQALTAALRDRPYPVLGAAVLAGYLAGGGLFSRWTRPLARAAMGALMMPGVRERLRDVWGRAQQPAGA